MEISGFLVERVDEFIQERDASNCKRYFANLEGTLPSGAIVHVEVDAYKLHPEWEKMSPKRILQFQEEMQDLQAKKIDVELNGSYHPNYESVRKAL